EDEFLFVSEDLISEEPGLTSAPGRVDSPPTSIRSAPSSRRCSACSTALSASKYKPPSEKESGVTLTTPMINVRFPNSSDRDPRFQWSMGRIRPILNHFIAPDDSRHPKGWYLR